MDYDDKLFHDISSACTEMENDHAERVDYQEKMEEIYNLRDEAIDDIPNLIPGAKIVYDPTPQVTVRGIKRLLTATEPVIAVPHDKNDASIHDIASEMEQMAGMMWRASGRISGRPVHYEVVRSAALFDQVAIEINSTKDMLQQAEKHVEDTEKDDNKANRVYAKAMMERMQDIHNITPYLYECKPPRCVFHERDLTGMKVYARKAMMRKADIIDRWGTAAHRIVDDYKRDASAYDWFWVWLYYDLRYCQIWMEGASQPFVQDEHGLPIIPAVVHTVEGSNMFEEVEDQIEPFLQTIDRAGLWKFNTLLLSAVATQMAYMGFTPPYIYTEGETTGSEPTFDFSGPFGMIKVPKDAKLERAKNTGALDADTMQYFSLSSSLTEEATMFKTALGQSLGATAPFSAVALLSQQGRLPLVTIQEISSWAIADVLKASFKWIKSDSGEYRTRFQNKESVINPADIPDTFELEASLEVDLPQDRLQSADIFNRLEKHIPKRVLAEELLHLGQYEDLQEELWEQQWAEARFATMVQAKIQELAARAGMQQGGPPPGGPMEGGPPEGMPPEAAMMGGQGPQPPAYEEGM